MPARSEPTPPRNDHLDQGKLGQVTELFPYRMPFAVAGGLASFLIAFCAICFVASLVVKVPESVQARFVLLPVGGADPVQSPFDGVIETVQAKAAAEVAAGDLLFTIRAPSIQQLAGDRRTLEADLAGVGKRREANKENHAVAVRLLLSSIDTKIAPAFDAVSKLYSFTFVNPDTYAVSANAPDYLAGSAPVTVLPGDIAALEVRLDADPSATDYNAADTDQNGALSLGEILRIVQFYNSRALHCDATTEDGFAPGTGAQDCTPHSADYAPQDWKISLSEILRMVQFYNSHGYYACAEGEDGFCAGPQP